MVLTMIDFKSRESLSQCNNGPWLIMVDSHIKTIIVTVRRWTMVDHSLP